MRIDGLTDSYELSEWQGVKGKFGQLLKGVRLSDGFAVIAKKLVHAISPEEMAARSIVVELNHPNLASVIESVQVNGDTYFIRPYIEGTSLKTISQKYSIHKHLSSSFYIKMAIELLNGIDYLHKLGILHRDIKPSNIIIAHALNEHPRNWSSGSVVLIDFEQACTFPIESRSRSPFAMVYAAPEQLLNYNFLCNQSTDLFALTVTLYELLAGKKPWQDCNAELLMNLQLTYPLKQPRHIDHQLFEILAKGAYKEPFPMPPRRLASHVIEEILSSGVKKRLASSIEYSQLLTAYLESAPKLEKISWFERFLRG